MGLTPTATGLVPARSPVGPVATAVSSTDRTRRDLIRACCTQTPRSAVRPPGRCDHPPASLREDGDHHHGTPHTAAGHRRGRHPQGHPRRRRAGPARPSAWHDPGAGQQRRLRAAAVLGPRPGRGRRLGRGGHRQLRRRAGPLPGRPWSAGRGGQPARPAGSAAARQERCGRRDAAARAVQAGEATGVPKAQDGVVEMLRALRAARQTAVKARTQAINALKGLLVTAPAELPRAAGRLPTAGWSVPPPSSRWAR